MTMEPLWHRVPGGTARYTSKLAAALTARGDTEVVGVAGRHGRRPSPPWEPTADTRHMRWPGPILYELWTRGAASIDEEVGDVDLVHATSVIPPATRRPLVVTVHDLAFTDPRSGFGRRVAAVMLRGWQNTLERAAAVIVPSRTTADLVVAAGLAADRVHVVPEGAEPRPVDDAERRAVRQRYQLDRPFVLTTGTVEPRKNLDGVLAAFGSVARRRDVDLVMVGPDGWGSDLRTMVRRSGAPAERVRPLGFVPDVDLRALYSEADVFCYPSWAEGFGLPVLEAMAQGAAVVTSSTTATAEICGDAGLAVDPANQARLTAAVARLLDRPEERAEYGRRALARAARFTWERAAEGTRGVYAAVTGPVPT
jgi:glycosyltransferase involved in cell wall biosynthesis